MDKMLSENILKSLEVTIQTIQNNEEEKNRLIKIIIASAIYVNVVLILIISILFLLIFYMVFESYNASYPMPQVDNTLKNEVNVNGEYNESKTSGTTTKRESLEENKDIVE